MSSDKLSHPKPDLRMSKKIDFAVMKENFPNREAENPNGELPGILVLIVFDSEDHIQLVLVKAFRAPQVLIFIPVESFCATKTKPLIQFLDFGLEFFPFNFGTSNERIA
jgi:hypothetical protein